MGGITPSEVEELDGYWKVRAIYEGVCAKSRSAYDSTRLLAWQILMMFGNEDSRSRCRSPRDMIEFPWEREDEDEEGKAEELKRLLESTRRMNDEGIYGE